MLVIGGRPAVRYAFLVRQHSPHYSLSTTQYSQFGRCHILSGVASRCLPDPCCSHTGNVRVHTRCKQWTDENDDPLPAHTYNVRAPSKPGALSASVYGRPARPVEREDLAEVIELCATKLPKTGGGL